MRWDGKRTGNGRGTDGERTGNGRGMDGKRTGNGGMRRRSTTAPVLFILRGGRRADRRPLSDPIDHWKMFAHVRVNDCMDDEFPHELGIAPDHIPEDVRLGMPADGGRGGEVRARCDNGDRRWSCRRSGGGPATYRATSSKKQAACLFSNTDMSLYVIASGCFDLIRYELLTPGCSRSWARAASKRA